MGTRCQRGAPQLPWGACPRLLRVAAREGFAPSGLIPAPQAAAAPTGVCRPQGKGGHPQVPPVGACELWHQGRVMSQGTVYFYALKCLHLELAGMIYLEVSFFFQPGASFWLNGKKSLILFPVSLFACCFFTQSK